MLHFQRLFFIELAIMAKFKAISTPGIQLQLCNMSIIYAWCLLDRFLKRFRFTRPNGPERNRNASRGVRAFWCRRKSTQTPSNGGSLIYFVARYQFVYAHVAGSTAQATASPSASPSRSGSRLRSFISSLNFHNKKSAYKTELDLCEGESEVGIAIAHGSHIYNMCMLYSGVGTRGAKGAQAPPAFLQGGPCPC